MEPVSIKELWMLLGEKDVQIYQLLKTIEVLTAQLEHSEPEDKKDG